MWFHFYFRLGECCEDCGHCGQIKFTACTQFTEVSDQPSLLTFFPFYCCPSRQPALLYIVPAVIGFLAAHCIWNGEVKQVCFISYVHLPCSHINVSPYFLCIWFDFKH